MLVVARGGRMIFDIAGPFEIQRHGKKGIITKASLDELKTDADSWEPGLTEACGCYIFAVRAAKGWTPYYVGQACMRSLVREALNASNIDKYNTAMNERGRGTPVLFLIPMKTPQGKFRKRPKSKLKALNFMERWLIAQALDRNPNLINTKETKFLRSIHVRGVFNAKKGEANKATNEFGAMLWQ